MDDVITTVLGFVVLMICLSLVACGQEPTYRWDRLAPPPEAVYCEEFWEGQLHDHNANRAFYRGEGMTISCPRPRINQGYAECQTEAGIPIECSIFKWGPR